MAPGGVADLTVLDAQLRVLSRPGLEGELAWSGTSRRPGTVLNGVTSRLFACAGLTAVALGRTACVVNVDHEGTIERDEKRFTVEKIAELHLYTFDGAIEVRSWDRPEVVVQIEKRGQDKDAVAKIEILSEQKGDRLQVEARHTGQDRLRRGACSIRRAPA